MHDVVIIGAGIGGLSLALALHERRIPCRVYEASVAVKPVGVGVNLLPHCTKVLAGLGLEDALAARAVTTLESAFFNRFGQLIHREPAGRAAGYDWPQFSIHRADLYEVLLEAVVKRLGPDAVRFGWTSTGVAQDRDAATAHFKSTHDGAALPSQSAAVIVACDGIHSIVRKQFYPEEGEPRYSGVNMWRGVTRMKPILSGGTMVRAGWLSCGKMVIYPIRNAIDAEGNQLMNWVAEIETPRYLKRDWSRDGKLDDFLPVFADWRFDWLDVPAMISGADRVLEFPMVDQDPLERWSFGRITLLGDAAHPMVPRGSNGAGQAILDAPCLAACLVAHKDAVEALKAYENERLGPTTRIVLTNRSNPPDAVLREVFERTGDRPFDNIDTVISRAELLAITDGYKQVAGYDRERLRTP